MRSSVNLGITLQLFLQLICCLQCNVVYAGGGALDSSPGGSIYHTGTPVGPAGATPTKAGTTFTSSFSDGLAKAVAHEGK